MLGSPSHLVVLTNVDFCRYIAMVAECQEVNSVLQELMSAEASTLPPPTQTNKHPPYTDRPTANPDPDPGPGDTALQGATLELESISVYLDLASESMMDLWTLMGRARSRLGLGLGLGFRLMDRAGFKVEHNTPDRPVPPSPRPVDTGCAWFASLTGTCQSHLGGCR